MKSTLNLKRACGNVDIPLVSFSCTETPTYMGPCKGVNIDSVRKCDGHTRANTPKHLLTWTFPEKMEEIREKIERVLEDEIPDQKRTMLRNQEWGTLDDRWADSIAIGDEIDNPFQRWSKSAANTCRVAICLDGSVWGGQSAENLASRVIVAAGLAAALESLDYEVQITGAVICSSGVWSEPRGKSQNVKAYASCLKGEGEPLTTSAFASLSDTGIARMLLMWKLKGDGRTTGLTDSEWRELTEADLFIHIKGESFNSSGLPHWEKKHLTGPDVLTLEVRRYKDINAATDTIAKFFQQAEA